jgi:hypothetical protein
VLSLGEDLRHAALAARCVAPTTPASRGLVSSSPASSGLLRLKTARQYEAGGLRLFAAGDQPTPRRARISFSRSLGLRVASIHGDHIINPCNAKGVE